MKQYDAKKILNIALAGHSGCGKTSVAESILYLSKVSDRLGKIADGNTMLDFDAEEIKRQASIMTAVAPIEWKNTKINLCVFVLYLYNKNIILSNSLFL